MPPNFNNSFDNMLFPDRLRNLPPPSMDQRARFDRFRGNAGGGYSPPINFNPFIPAPREAPFSYGNQIGVTQHWACLTGSEVTLAEVIPLPRQGRLSLAPTVVAVAVIPLPVVVARAAEAICRMSRH